MQITSVRVFQSNCTTRTHKRWHKCKYAMPAVRSIHFPFILDQMGAARCFHFYWHNVKFGCHLKIHMRVHWKWSKTPSESNGNEQIYNFALRTCFGGCRITTHHSFDQNFSSSAIRMSFGTTTTKNKNQALTRPSTITGASGARWGLSITIGTDGAFGMARPRSIIAGCMWPDRKCGGLSCRKPE